MKLIILATLVAFASSQVPFASLRRGGSRRGPSLRLNAGPLGKAELNLGQLTPTTKLLVTGGKHPNVDRKTPQDDEQLYNEEFDTFKVEFNKNYATPEEEKFRKEVFIENRNKITKFNQDFSFGLSSFVEKLTPLADLLTNEFNSLFNGFGRTKDMRAERKTEPRASAYIPSASTTLPSSVDWRELGAVTSVKDQSGNGGCASCYAFSATGAVEGHHFRKTGDLVDLSPQNIIDCAKPDTYSNVGCNGGYVDEAFQYIKNNPGINVESVYPYKAADEQCHFDAANIGANVTGFVSLPEGDEEALATAVANHGPVSVAIDASLGTFQHYADGVYFDENCKNKGLELNHAVLVVGYGAEGNGVKYWIVKNSYGPDWGNGGYVKIAKDVNNHCGIATSAFYPLV